jgi:hypothetical protein
VGDNFAPSLAPGDVGARLRAVLLFSVLAVARAPSQIKMLNIHVALYTVLHQAYELHGSCGRGASILCTKFADKRRSLGRYNLLADCFHSRPHYSVIYVISESRNSAVLIVIGYRLDYHGVGIKIYHFSLMSRPALGSSAQPPTEWVTGAVSPKVKRPVHEADHPPLTTAKVKKRAYIHPLLHTPSWRSA